MRTGLACSKLGGTAEPPSQTPGTGGFDSPALRRTPMLHPTLEEVERRAHEGTMIPVYLELLADLETPMSAYMKMGAGPGSFLFESVEGGEHLGRFSFIGTEPSSTLTFRDGKAELSGELGEGSVTFADPLDLVDELLRRERTIPVAGLPRFHGGAVGYLSYDLVRYFERIPRPAGNGLGLPLGCLAWYKTLLAFDHLRRTIKIITHVPTTGDVCLAYHQAETRLEALAGRLRSGNGHANGDALSLAPTGARMSGEAQFGSNLSQQQFEDSVRRAKEYIAAGDAIQVVLSQRLSAPTS
ncbi:MAG: hypothetical protein Q7R57_06680, partial [Dehalococcoidales bacterium]|nr:hypothetical protein [Dehalococcoidales bacterium]